MELGSTFPGEQETFSGVSGRPRRPADTHNQGPTRQWLREYGRRRPSRDIRDPNHGRDGARAGPAFCSHFAPTNTPKYDETGTRTKHQQKTLNHLPLNAFPPRSEGYRTWPCCTHNPKVVGSNPTPATMNDEGLTDASAVSPFRVPRLHPGIGLSASVHFTASPDNEIAYENYANSLVG